MAVEPVQLAKKGTLARCRLMSPYVWREADGTFSMLLRVVDDRGDSTGSLWFARGDGLEFVPHHGPAVKPGPEPEDVGGCEDPTVVARDDGILVYYTGVMADGTAQLLYAVGPDAHSLGKRGVAHASTAADHNTKEAAIERLNDGWILLFEYSRDGRSQIGRAEAESPAGPWTEQENPIRRRKGQWDSWHLSTGPLLIDEPEGPVMFYNGATPDAVWSIGWVRFDATCRHVVERSIDPLIAAPAASGAAGRRISFAASAVRVEDRIFLYYTHDDRNLMRATLVCPFSKP